MKLPRDISAHRLVRILETLGYRVVRQRGSHVRLHCDGLPAHSVTVPMHDPLKVGTLHGILFEVASMRSVSLDSLVSLL